MTADAGETVIDRERLAGALRTAAECWDGPRVPDWPPRPAAAYVIRHMVDDQPRRASEWLGDGQEGLTAEQARRAIFGYVARAAPEGEAGRAWQAVADAYAGVLTAPSDNSGPVPESAAADGPAPRACLWCHRPVPLQRGPLARYCKTGCRVSHHRARKREANRRSPAGTAPLARGAAALIRERECEVSPPSSRTVPCAPYAGMSRLPCL